MNAHSLCSLRPSILVLLACLVFLPVPVTHAQETVHLDASTLLPRVSVSFSPRSGSFVEGSTFEVPIILDTQGASINAIEIKVSFDEDKLMIVRPSGGKSVIGVWVEPPTYDNSRGTANYSGVVPNGIVTSSGIIGTIVFKAKATGTALVSIRGDSSILLNDGLGTDASVDFGRASYDIIPKAPEGVRIFSETHPDQSKFYNNNSPVLSWAKDSGVSGFSGALDDKPSTIPGNTISTTDTVQAFEDLGDGLWYFHIKAYKNGVWGTTGHFLLKIDTTPPADFTPKVEYALASAALIERTLISFFTTDSLSGMDHYEVGVIDKEAPITDSPLFVQAESPFQVPPPSANGFRVIVRAVDKAGNIRDVSIDIQAQSLVGRIISGYLLYIIMGALLVGGLTLVLHYLIGHRVLAHLRRVTALIRRDILNG